MSLQLPTLFHGRYRDVKPRISKVITRIRRGGDSMELLTADGFLDVATTPGYLVLNGPSSTLGGDAHFQAWLFWMMFRDREDTLPEGLPDQVFDRSLTTPWSTLGLIATGNQFWVVPRDRHIPFLRAVVTCWDELMAVGSRYSNGSQYPDHLWKIPTTVHHALARLGVPIPVLNSPLPPGGLLALVTAYGIDLTAAA